MRICCRPLSGISGAWRPCKLRFMGRPSIWRKGLPYPDSSFVSGEERATLTGSQSVDALNHVPVYGASRPGSGLLVLKVQVGWAFPRWFFSHEPLRGDWFVVITAVHTVSRVRLFVTPGTAALQASLSFTISQSLLRLMPIESMKPSNHLILCHPLLLPSIFPCIRAFSNESVLCIRWPKYWSFNFSISLFNDVRKIKVESDLRVEAKMSVPFVLF